MRRRRRVGRSVAGVEGSNRAKEGGGCVYMHCPVGKIEEKGEGMRTSDNGVGEYPEKGWSLADRQVANAENRTGNASSEIKVVTMRAQRKAQSPSLMLK